MPDKKLIVIGDGPDFNKIKSKAANNIELLGYQSTEKLIHYLQRAKAFVFAAEEDFGMLPLEAQACGTPVIAYGKGGALETVIGINQNNPTGVFFDRQTVSSLQNGVMQFEKHQHEILQKNCVENASQFSPEKFRETFKAFTLKQFP